MGKRRGLPVVQMPVVSNLTISASLAGGFPPILGAISGQFDAPSTGAHRTDAPCNHRLRSRPPLLFRGVWHSPHIATPSTRYFPRATSPPLLPVSAAPHFAGAVNANKKIANNGIAKADALFRCLRGSHVKLRSDRLLMFTSRISDSIR